MTPDEFDLLRMQAISVAKSSMMGAKGLPQDEAEADAIAKILVARELGLPPVSAALNLLYMIPAQGGKRLTMSGQSMLSLIHQSGAVTVQIEQQDGSCAVTMTRNDNGFTMTTEWDLDRAKRAGVAGKDNWTKAQAEVLRWRAIAECARVVCPDVLCGMYATEEFGMTADEAGRAEREPRVVTPDDDDTPIGAHADQMLRDRYAELVARGADEQQLARDFATVRNGYRVGAKAPSLAALPRAGVRALLRMCDKAEAALPKAEDVAEGDFEPVEAEPEEVAPQPEPWVPTPLGGSSRLQVETEPDGEGSLFGGDE